MLPTLAMNLISEFEYPVSAFTRTEAPLLEPVVATAPFCDVLSQL